MESCLHPWQAAGGEETLRWPSKHFQFQTCSHGWLTDWEDFCWYYGDCSCCCCFSFTTLTRERRPCGITNTYFGHGDLFISSCKYSTTFGWSEPTVRTMKSRYAMSAAITGERNVHLHWLEKEGRGEGDGDWPGAVTCIMDYMYVSCWTSSGILLFVCIINSNSGSYVALCRVHRELKRLLFSCILQHQRALIWIITINEHT